MTVTTARDGIKDYGSEIRSGSSLRRLRRAALCAGLSCSRSTGAELRWRPRLLAVVRVPPCLVVAELGVLRLEVAQPEPVDSSSSSSLSMMKWTCGTVAVGSGRGARPQLGPPWRSSPVQRTVAAQRLASLQAAKRSTLQAQRSAKHVPGATWRDGEKTSSNKLFRVGYVQVVVETSALAHSLARWARFLSCASSGARKYRTAPRWALR